MKKIILTLGLVFTLVLTANANNYDKYNDFMQSLKLSSKQKEQIEAIEKDYSKKRADLRAEIILRKMEIAQIKGMKNSSSRVASLNQYIKNVQADIDSLDSEKYSEVAHCLGFIQKFKYKRFIKSLKQS